jgi:hypothetical protein
MIPRTPKVYFLARFLPFVHGDLQFNEVNFGSPPGGAMPFRKVEVKAKVE